MSKVYVDEKIERIANGLKKVEKKLSDGYEFYLITADKTDKEYENALRSIAVIILNELEQPDNASKT